MIELSDCNADEGDGELEECLFAGVYVVWEEIEHLTDMHIHELCIGWRCLWYWLYGIGECIDDDFCGDESWP